MFQLSVVGGWGFGASRSSGKNYVLIGLIKFIAWLSHTSRTLAVTLEGQN